MQVFGAVTGEDMADLGNTPIPFRVTGVFPEFF